MKKLIALLLSAALLAAGCDPNTTSGANQAPPSYHSIFESSPVKAPPSGPAPRADAMPLNGEALFSVYKCHLYLVPDDTGIEMSDTLHIKTEVRVHCDTSPYSHLLTLRLQLLYGGKWITEGFLQDGRNPAAGHDEYYWAEATFYPGVWRLWVSVSGVGSDNKTIFYAERATPGQHYRG